MNKTIALLASAFLLLALGSTQAEPPPLDKPATTRPIQAKPVQKPQATSDRDKASLGWHDDDDEEPTQERPNPLDYKPAQKPQATSGRAKAGYGIDSDGLDPEPTQERPNPMDSRPTRAPAPMR